MARTDEMTELVLIGGGGHALVTCEAAQCAGWRVVGFLDDDENAEVGGGVVRLGSLEETNLIPAGARVIVALGEISLRRRVIAGLTGPLATVVHLAAWISPSARIGRGVLIGAGAIVQGRAHVGNHAIVNTGVIVEHDCEVGENVHLAPRAVLGGAVRIGADTLVGIGACVKPGVRIGTKCVIGAGAAVVSDIEDGATAVGVPARAVACSRIGQ